MSFKKELEVMLHQMTCRVPHPTNYDFFCEYRDVEIPKTADSIINLVDKELPEKKPNALKPGGIVLSEDGKTVAISNLQSASSGGYNQAIDDMRAKLKGDK